MEKTIGSKISSSFCIFETQIFRVYLIYAGVHIFPDKIMQNSHVYSKTHFGKTHLSKVTYIHHFLHTERKKKQKEK
jgi:hypothetical protein